jgi:hypothetical protein
MNTEQLKELLRKPEGLKFDFKQKLSMVDSSDNSMKAKFQDEFVRDILALVNGNIGTAGETAYLIVGAEDKLKSDGTRELHDCSHLELPPKEILQKVNARCNPPIPDVQCEFIEMDGKQIFIIAIPPTPYLHEATRDLTLPNQKTYPKNSIFIRRGEEINLASVEEIDAIRREKEQWHSLSLSNNKINWLEVCGKKLEKLKADSALRRRATSIGAEVNVYVPLDLLEHKEQPRTKQDKANLEQSNQFQERKILKTYEHDDFLRSLTDRQSKNKHIAIVGEAGAGKTTLLAKIADELDKKQKLQIFVSLADLQGRSLEEYIYGTWLPSALGVHRDSVNAEQKNDLFQQFQSGEIWLLLDGLDEMRAKSSADALEKINREIREVIGQSRVVLTSRLNIWDAYLNRLSDFDAFRMGDFSPEQVDTFISDWFASAEKPKNAANLQARLKEPNRDRIRDMVRHPLRLALLCQAFYRDPNAELPETKAGLYELFVRYFYEWKPNIVDEDLLTQDILREELHLALGKLAIAGDAGFRLSRSLAVKQMGDHLFNLANALGWLTLIERDEQDQEIYAFYHATFQEYFAAISIDTYQYFLDRALIFEPYWQEVILIWLSRIDILDETKDTFIDSLESFQECGGFYRDNAQQLIRDIFQEDCGVKKKPREHIITVPPGSSLNINLTDILIRGSFPDTLVFKYTDPILKILDREQESFPLSELFENESLSEIDTLLGQLVNAQEINHAKNVIEKLINASLSCETQISFEVNMFDPIGQDSYRPITWVVAKIFWELKKRGYYGLVSCATYFTYILEITDRSPNVVHNFVTRKWIAWFLIRILIEDRFKPEIAKILIKQLKTYTTEDTYKIDMTMFKWSRSIIARCARLPYQDFHHAWHSQYAFTHSEFEDTACSNNTNTLRELESQFVDRNAVQTELDRTAEQPEVRCLVVDMRQLQQEIDPNALAEEIGIRIFSSLGHRIPEIQRVTSLKRELLNLKFELGAEKLAIALYGNSANEAIAQLCQQLAPIQTHLFTGGQTTQELITKINAWLFEM